MKERKTFGGTIGFVLAAAGSAVGLGNIWRFPYLAAKDGGGLFLVVYIVLALTFGFALLSTEIAIGRKTRQSPLTCYGVLSPKWKPLGLLSCGVPAIILPYYCAIGGWVLKYFVVFLTGHGLEAAEDGFFTGFITDIYGPLFYMIIFLICCAAVIYLGVNKGIEASSKILMPILFILVIGIAVFCMFIQHTDESGVTRTGLQGLKIYLIPNVDGITVKEFVNVVIDAMGQLFFSLSVAMGIMIAYGSYVSDDANLSKSINQIEIFDTLVALLAGAMIIPAIYTFMGPDSMGAKGPGLIFVYLPKIFASMGGIGQVIGTLFFAMVLFAAVTSAVSIMEAVVSSYMDEFHINRVKATTIEFGIALVVGVIVCLGYNVFYFEYTLPNGTVGQILDIFDYISNNILMPLIGIFTCILVGWVLKPKAITDEITKNGESFRRKGLYNVMIRYIAPVFLIILFLTSIGILKVL